MNQMELLCDTWPMQQRLEFPIDITHHIPATQHIQHTIKGDKNHPHHNQENNQWAKGFRLGDLIICFHY